VATPASNWNPLIAHLGGLRERLAQRAGRSQWIGNVNAFLNELSDRLAGRRAWSARFPYNSAQDIFAYQLGEASHHTVPIYEAVANCVRGVWDVPRFQRGFAWSATMVRDLAESLWRGYPIGPILLWQDTQSDATDNAPLWVVDGQQRLTALCILFDATPHWRPARSAKQWENSAKRCTVFFDPQAIVPPFFRTSDMNYAEFREALVPLSTILEPAAETCDDAHLAGQLTEQIAAASRLAPMQRSEVFQRLLRVRRIRRQHLPVTIVTHQLADVLEMYERISGGGLRFRRLLLRALSQAIRARWRCRKASDS
jgi:hypothetical protein